jgi:hypothetical protein
MKNPGRKADAQRTLVVHGHHCLLSGSTRAPPVITNTFAEKNSKTSRNAPDSFSLNRRIGDR